VQHDSTAEPQQIGEQDAVEGEAEGVWKGIPRFVQEPHEDIGRAEIGVENAYPMRADLRRRVSDIGDAPAPVAIEAQHWLIVLTGGCREHLLGRSKVRSRTPTDVYLGIIRDSVPVGDEGPVGAGRRKSPAVLTGLDGDPKLRNS
jgi:hypothetical protein